MPASKPPKMDRAGFGAVLKESSNSLGEKLAPGGVVKASSRVPGSVMGGIGRAQSKELGGAIGTTPYLGYGDNKKRDHCVVIRKGSEKW